MPKPQYSQKFRDEWLMDPLFRDWLRKVESTVGVVGKCKYCGHIVRNHRGDLKNHGNSATHQKNANFPKNEELADLWNIILKRGKPYTKYSKVCSLHFKPEDYTITSMGKNKAGQWRSLRKDAVPSRNLPDEVPVHHQSHQQRSCTPVGAGLPISPNIMDPKVQQQMAQAIYMQTMLAMQAAAYSESDRHSVDLSQLSCLKQDDARETDASDSNDGSDASSAVSTAHQPNTSTSSDISKLQRFLLKYSAPEPPIQPSYNSYKCSICSKFFKDPDVLLIHQRTHRPVQKENLFVNRDSTNTLRANPILANLLRPDETAAKSSIDKAMALNMEAYIKNITDCCDRESDSDSELSLNESKSPKLVIDETLAAPKRWL